MKARKKYLRILAAGTAFLLIFLLFFVLNSFVGNPISASIATAKIRTYVKENYQHLDLEVPKATYNFKNSEYFSFVQSKTSEDTRFAVSWRRGEIYDSYEFEVINRFTTYRRLQSEFNEKVERIIDEEFAYETNLVLANFYKNDEDFSKLTLDMDLDIHNPPLNASLTIWTTSEEISYDILAKRLIKIHHLMEEHKIPIDMYSLRLEKPYEEDEKPGLSTEELYLSDFPAEKVTEDNLIEVIQEYQARFEEENNKEKP